MQNTWQRIKTKDTNEQRLSNLVKFKGDNMKY